MNHPFASLIDSDNMQGLLDGFCEAVGIASAIIDLQGEVLVASNWQRICTRFHRVNPASCARCIESDTSLANQLSEGSPHAIYRCRNGLTDAAAPIVIEGEHVANFFVGQFLMETPDLASFREQARQFGFDEAAYLAALADVPIVPEQKLRPVLTYLAQFAQTLGTIGLKEVRRREAEVSLRMLNEELEARVHERTAQLETANRELREAKDAADAANRAKSVFLANMSHELRTPMNAIMGYSQLMQRDASLPPRQRRDLDTICRSGEHLLALINDVLEISKIEAGRVATNPITFDLHQLVADLETMFRVRTDAKGLRLEVSLSPAVPRSLHGDEGRLRQVLINVLGNAVKFTHAGSIDMRVSIREGDGQKLTLLVDVEDTGVGIASDDLARVFLPFEQTAAGRQAEDGTGLGLAISREYARIMGGDLTAASELGRGSVFRLAVQAARGAPEGLAQAGPPRRVTALAAGQPEPRVLVVDDRQTNRDVLVRILSAVGFCVREAEDGQAALDAVHQWAPQAILMDVRMPGMDGLEATRRIKAFPRGERVVVVAVSASVFEEDRQAVLAAGCDDFLRKPYHEQEIYEVLAKHLGLGYVYAEEQTGDLPAHAPSELRPGQLAALPAGLRNRLCEAAVELDTDRALALIDQVSGHDPAAGHALRELAHKLDYDGLLSLLEREDTDTENSCD